MGGVVCGGEGGALNWRVGVEECSEMGGNGCCELKWGDGGTLKVGIWWG